MEVKKEVKYPIKYAVMPIKGQIGCYSSLNELEREYDVVASKLSPEEREYLKQLIENRCCINCTNGSCRIETCEKIGLDEFGKPQGSSCLSWDNPELIGKQLILKKSNNI